jgi:hypothetical protein
MTSINKEYKGEKELFFNSENNDLNNKKGEKFYLQNQLSTYIKIICL